MTGLPYELADYCKICIKEHKELKGSFKTGCKGIPKTLMGDMPYFPLNSILPNNLEDQISDELKAELQVKNNKLLWAKEYLNWSTYNKEREFDQWYQKLMLNCTAKKKVFRCGRRVGKTETIGIDVLHFAQNNPGKNIIIVGPFQNLIDEIFERLCKQLDDELSAYVGEYDRKRQPNILMLKNGSKISGFTTGTNGDGIRGQSADRIYLDEAGYIPPLAFRAVLALLMESKDVSIIAASTPSALETNFKKWCLEDPEWKAFHFPSTIFPYFHELEHTFRSAYSNEDYKLEIEAEFIEGSSRTFKSRDVEASLEEYEYIHNKNQLENPNDWITVIGCDWNEHAHGVRIVVLGFNKRARGKPFKVLNVVSIHSNTDGNMKNNVQIKGVRTIKELYYSFKADFVYVDRGHGSMQCEELSEFFFKINKPSVFKAIDFSSNYLFDDIYTGEAVNKRLKVMMVYFLQKRFEFREIILSKTEESKPNGLIDQLNNYSIARYDNRGQPIFDGTLKGDHILDALMLAVFAFVENFSTVFDKGGGVFVDSVAKSVDSELIEIPSITNEYDSDEQNKPTLLGFNKLESNNSTNSNTFIVKKKKKKKGSVNYGFF